jgi:hypothetical protein
MNGSQLHHQWTLFEDKVVALGLDPVLVAWDKLQVKVP